MLHLDADWRLQVLQSIYKIDRFVSVEKIMIRDATRSAMRGGTLS